MAPRFTPSHRTGSGTPMVLIHPFTDTWRSWEPLMDELAPHHELLAVTLAGHAGGPEIDEHAPDSILADEVERAMDAAGFDTAHVVGNSLGGFVALQLAERGRARSVLALAPAGGWPADDVREYEHTLRVMRHLRRHTPLAAHLAHVVAATPLGRRIATRIITSHAGHVGRQLLVHQIHGARKCTIADPLLDGAHDVDWSIDPTRIECPVRVAWGTDDRVLRYPGAATRFREEWLTDAEWFELEGGGHCPQLDDPQLVAELVLELTRRVD